MSRSVQAGAPDSEPETLGTLDGLTTRFAANEREIEAAFRLRYSVFVEEMGARPEQDNGALERDEHDERCRHLLVLDGDEVVGTYRISHALAGQHTVPFYSASEFQLDNLWQAAAGKQVMEFGRSCIAQPYRNRRTMKLLWQGAWAAAVEEKAAVMFGCASLPGSDVGEHHEAFAWLAHHALLPPEQDCPPVTNGFDMRNVDLEPKKRMFKALPPLIKGYLRLGAKVASHAVSDAAFGTTDVLIVLDVASIAPRYADHYNKQVSRSAA